eukprot:1542140-Rhodomonas_salina.1
MRRVCGAGKCVCDASNARVRAQERACSRVRGAKHARALSETRDEDVRAQVLLLKVDVDGGEGALLQVQSLGSRV